MSGDPALHLRDAGERPVPARLKLAGDQPVGRIGGVILPEGAVGGVARCFEITAKSLTHLVPLLRGLLRPAIAAATAPGPTTPRSASSMASSTRRPPKAMQRGSPLSIQPRLQL